MRVAEETLVCSARLQPPSGPESYDVQLFCETMCSDLSLAYLGFFGQGSFICDLPRAEQ